MRKINENIELVTESREQRAEIKSTPGLRVDLQQQQAQKLNFSETTQKLISKLEENPGFIPYFLQRTTALPDKNGEIIFNTFRENHQQLTKIFNDSLIAGRPEDSQATDMQVRQKIVEIEEELQKLKDRAPIIYSFLVEELKETKKFSDIQNERIASRNQLSHAILNSSPEKLIEACDYISKFALDEYNNNEKVRAGYDSSFKLERLYEDYNGSIQAQLSNENIQQRRNRVLDGICNLKKDSPYLFILFLNKIKE